MYLISIANNLFSFCRTIMKQVSIERSNLKVLFGMLYQLLKHPSMGLNAPSFVKHKSAGYLLQEIISHRLNEVWISCFNSAIVSGRPSWISCFIQSLMKKFSGLRSGKHCGQIESDILTSVFLVIDQFQPFMKCGLGHHHASKCYCYQPLQRIVDNFSFKFVVYRSFFAVKQCPSPHINKSNGMA